MKKLGLLLLFIGLLASCNNEDADNNAETALVGTWKLTQIYSDPGTGDGTFHEVDSEKTVTFHENGTFTSNGLMCMNYVTTDTPSSGTYSLTDSTFMTDACDQPAHKYKFVLEGNTLTVAYSCIEGCASRFTKQ